MFSLERNVWKQGWAGNIFHSNMKLPSPASNHCNGNGYDCAYINPSDEERRHYLTEILEESERDRDVSSTSSSHITGFWNA